MRIYEKLDAVTSTQHSLLCIGLDTDTGKLPLSFKNSNDAQFLFNTEIIHATHDLVCAYKINSAFYEAHGAVGIEQLKKTCDMLRQEYPEIMLILDAKRADIGNTNFGYVSFAFDYLGADAITLHPYLGKEALEPFLRRSDKASIILCKTSNPGSGEFQDSAVNGQPLYKVVARHVSEEWNQNQNCMLVVGATYPEELKSIRNSVGEMPILIPGIGAQGGDIEKTLRAGLTKKGKGIVLSISRSILFASDGADFASAARRSAQELNNTINSFR